MDDLVAARSIYISGLAAEMQSVEVSRGLATVRRQRANSNCRRRTTAALEEELEMYG